jgi:hypothetical protein
VTIFAGIASLASEAPIPRPAFDALALALSRNPADAPQRIEGAGYAFVHLDLGILGGAGVHRDEAGAVSLLAGAPLLAQGAGAREADLRALHEAWRREDASRLAAARGSWCCAHFDPAARRLTLACDKLGLRPIYYCVQDGRVYFATALRVLEALPELARRIDAKGLAESATFGYPLGSRSQYETIAVLGAGETVEFGRDGERRHAWWRWDRLPPPALSDAELPGALYRAFEEAVRLRLGAERSVVAFLSGGLDSRCTVAVLRKLGTEVQTMNFGPAGSADLVLGRLAAEQLGARHFEVPAGPIEFWDRMLATYEAWRTGPTAAGVEHPRRVWSGEGGSVGLGHVYVTPEIVALMRAGDAAGAARTYMRNASAGLARRVFRPAWRERMGDPLAGIVEELGRLASPDPARNFHLYLMLNGQRRLLARHCEQLDLRRFELVMPFFDAEVIELVLARPVDEFLRHRFYLRWLKEFPPETTAVAWQAYPGHEPCPVPAPEGLRGQWGAGGWYREEEYAQMRREDLAAIRRLLRDPRFPGWLLDRGTLWAAAWLTRLRLRDYSYLFKTAQALARYAVNAGPPKT